MELTNQSGVLALFQTDKAARKSFVDQILLQLSEGAADPIQVHLQLKCMEDVCEQIKASTFYKNLLLEEAAKQGKKFTYQNAEFQVKEAGIKYDYSLCGDSVLNTMLQEYEALGKQIKIRQEMLKNVAPGTQLLNEDEVLTLYPPSKTSTTIVQVTLK